MNTFTIAQAEFVAEVNRMASQLARKNKDESFASLWTRAEEIVRQRRNKVVTIPPVLREEMERISNGRWRKIEFHKSPERDNSDEFLGVRTNGSGQFQEHHVHIEGAWERMDFLTT